MIVLSQKNTDLLENKDKIFFRFEMNILRMYTCITHFIVIITLQIVNKTLLTGCTNGVVNIWDIEKNKIVKVRGVASVYFDENLKK